MSDFSPYSQLEVQQLEASIEASYVEETVIPTCTAPEYFAKLLTSKKPEDRKLWEHLMLDRWKWKKHGEKHPRTLRYLKRLLKPVPSNH